MDSKKEIHGQNTPGAYDKNPRESSDEKASFGTPLSLWRKTTVLPSFPALEGEAKTDVLVIGGGMAGILTAYYLTKAGIDCILVEKGSLCSGTTQNTTAKLTYQHGLCYHRLEKTFGLAAAALYLEANRAALSEYEALCQKIPCHYEKKDNYVYSLDDRKKLEKESQTLEKLGCPVLFSERPPLPFATAGAVGVRDQACFHPLEFLAALIDGLRIYENTFVRKMADGAAVTDRGKISFRRAVVATHFPFLNKHGGFYLKLYQHRSYVIALEGAPALNGMYLDEDKKGLSFRNYENLFLLGGGSHRTGKKGGNWEELRRFAQTYYPASREVAFWATQDCMSLDGMPYVGQYSSSTPNLYVASGFNKWGMTGSMMAAGLLSDLLSGRKNRFASLFDPSRCILRPQLAVNGFEAVINLLTPTTRRCPHLGCALKYNAAERSWDCPCHGSRFTEGGELLDNPANGDRKKS